ncbi:SpoIID/LytB domain-containing protein [Synechococcus sp. RSCCF101]|uniref:SpoIID/LytB domain-containing protein n=1 Tax=Synechococcus sp. RSCCF101 TaxID=2511069 RepID=UPI0012458AA7|nr:SpoIID/LytB domain-containing protein [Synechococcus sp. RSCCF101]QEY33162.1 SpoIID/LytB domain-containing protein [Synechococcus sp. RSCCF101]
MRRGGLSVAPARGLAALVGVCALLASAPLAARPLSPHNRSGPSGLDASSAVAMGSDPMMRILVRHGPDVTLRAPRGRELEVRDGSGRTLARLKDAQRLQLRMEGGALTVRGPGAAGSGLRGAQAELWVLSVPAAGGAAGGAADAGVWLHPRRYRGALRIVPAGEALEVINHIPLETYLPSVVGAEMPAEWPLAALQAQAVAARTYALRHRGRRGRYDLKATVASQVYKGVESETESTRQAVHSTRDLVLTFRGRLIDAVFHSSSGGRTAYSGQVWTSQLPYLISVPDHDEHSPVHRWRKPLDAATLRRAFSEIGGVHSIRISGTSPSGRVRQALVLGPGGQLSVSGRELRRRLGLRSTLVTFEPLQPAAPTAVPADVAADRAGVRWRPGMQPMVATRSVSPFSGEMVPVAPSPTLPVPETQAMGLVAVGRGFGHGVGMSQWGAHGLALQGETYRTILRHYYRGVQITPHTSMGSGPLARLQPAGRRAAMR